MNQLYVPPLTKINKVIIIASVSLFVINALSSQALGFSLTSMLGLVPAKIFDGHLYQLFTYSFLPTSLIGVLFECLLLWFLGSELESLWGERTYLQFLGSAVLGGALTYILISTFFLPHYTMIPMTGLAGIGYSMCLGYAIMFSERYLTFMLIFPMKAKWFCLIMICILVYTGFVGQGGAWGHLGAMATGFLYLRWKASQSGRKSSGFVGKMMEKIGKSKKSKANLYIVKGDDDENPPTYH